MTGDWTTGWTVKSMKNDFRASSHPGPQFEFVAMSVLCEFAPCRRTQTVKPNHGIFNALLHLREREREDNPAMERKREKEGVGVTNQQVGQSQIE